MTLILLFGGLLTFVLLGFPVILAIGLTSAVGIMVLPGVNFGLFAQRTFAMIDSFSLLALPYFILAGALMAKGGLSRALVNFAQTLVGHLRGSLGHTSVVTCTAMANVSGSSAAEAATVGSILIPEMKRQGYPGGLASAIVAVSAIIGPIIPPSMTMIVYGAMTGVSIGGLFLAGIFPGLGLALTLMLFIRYLAGTGRYPALAKHSVRATPSEMIRAVGNAWVALLAPFIILGGIFAGVFTATEAGVVACLYSAIVSMLVYREIGLRDLPNIVLDATVTTAMVVGIIAVTGALGWILAYVNFIELILGFLRGVSDNGYVIVLLMLAIVLVLTMFLESLSVLIVFVPIATYVGQAYGFDPLHLGIMMILANQIGAVSPPVAVLLFVTNAIAKVPYMETVRHAAPFILLLIVYLIVLVFVPQISTLIPSLVQP
ncbi:TRAP transporter large permease [Cohaesibacter celericrescens]|uniref:TRAP transporter large permease protein n=1 Tax=Cohaesibacter celericrescens TaxID=2067669 RepID=A0A2N5XLX3_9HYPH|nr:TRAP transporter large permease [Cohaesibacter celericrescens]PLW75427.1 TRAP transporter large permease [Cohaesibacter celericrescens]